MDQISAFFDVLPPQMRDPVIVAVPFFILFLAIEWTAARKLQRLENEDREPKGAFHTRDSWASVSMGLVSILTMGTWKFLGLLAYTAIFAYLAPWHLSASQWYTWVIAILGVDLLFYTYHRMAHRVRLMWATHQSHHSSEYFNFATALRQKWNNIGEILIWIPLPFLGVPPWMVFFSFSLNLIYQFWVHTEKIDKLWRPFEFIFNTPSHHRVHHGMDKIYLDKNYAGIFILWDRMFGTFQAEEFRPRYGLTKPVGTFNIWKLQTHEYAAIIRDVRSAKRWRDRLGYIFGPPGWQPRDAVQASAPSGTPA